MKPRIPLAYAGLLIIALVAVVGFAAFSPSGAEEAVPTVAEELSPTVTQASARVASAILALRVSDAESRTATTAEPRESDEPSEAVEPEDTSVEPAPAATSEEPTTTAAPTTSAAPTSTAATTKPADTTPPSLSITSPDDGSTVTDKLLTFKGTTEAGARVFSGPFEAAVDDEGNWSVRLTMSSGANGAAITARDAAGNETTKRIVVHYEAPASTTTTTKASSTTTTTTATTTTTSAATKWSPLWPADSGGRRDVEEWRSLVANYWPADLVDCALGLIKKESEGDPRAYNSYSSAEGLFQHLSKYWTGRAAAAGFKDADGLYASPYNAEANIAAAWVIAKASDPWYRPWTVTPDYGTCTP